MKNVIIKGVYAVGMHHWGQRSLQIDDVLYVKNEPDNHFDKMLSQFLKTENDKQMCLSSKGLCESFSAIIRGKLATWFGIP